MLYRLAAAAFAVLCLAAPSHAQMRAAPAGFFIMQCRGALHLEVANPGGINSLWIHFTRAAGPSGARGERLVSGQCSWLDRAVNASEPAKIRFETQVAEDAGHQTQRNALVAAVAACAQNSACILRVPVRRIGTGATAFFAPATNVETYPAR